MEQLLVTSRHKELTKLLSGDNNGTCSINPEEVKHLAWLGANIPMGGDVVEIGSHRGKSICCMGTGCIEAGNYNARLFAIDLWTSTTKTFQHYHSQETWEIFNKQVAQMGLTDMVRPIMKSSLLASMKRKKPIHLLFIDANHAYEHVREDYLVWHKFIPEGGRIAFHDYKTRFKGVTRVIDEIVIPSNYWQDFRHYGRIWSATRK